MSSLEERLADASANLDRANQAVDEFYDTERARVDAKLAQADAKLADVQDGFDNLKSDIPLVNLLGDFGRFTTTPNELFATGFKAPSYLQSYNGSSALVSAGRFVHDNATFGGNAGHLTEPVAALFNDLPGSNGRYGVEYHVAEFTQGTSAAAPAGNTGAYLALACNSRPVGPKVSISYFVRVTGGGFATVAGAKIDGEDYDRSLINDGRWHHVLLHQTARLGYNNAFPAVYATPNAKVQLACMSFIPGHTAELDHTYKHPIVGAGFWE